MEGGDGSWCALALGAGSADEASASGSWLLADAAGDSTEVAATGSGCGGVGSSQAGITTNIIIGRIITGGTIIAGGHRLVCGSMGRS
jgi:hypothetical protein